MAVELDWTPDLGGLGRAVIALGVFDGVHIGHQELLADCHTAAQSLHCEVAVITFDPDPEVVVNPDSAPPHLLSRTDRVRFLMEAGADTVLVVPFDQNVAAMTAEQFLDSIVGTSFDPALIVVGVDFRFGAGAAGDVDTIIGWANRRGVEVTPHELIRHRGQPVTATRIRNLIAEGDVAQAAELLGRPHRLTGVVRRGRGAGRSVLGVPTANLDIGPGWAKPADGVYAGRAVLDNASEYDAAISVGVPPTFPEATDRLEVHLIGFEGDLYDQQLTVEFVARLREQRRFAGSEALAAAIAQDVAAVPEALMERYRAEDPELLDIVDDPEALHDAEQAVADFDPLRPSDPGAVPAPASQAGSPIMQSRSCVVTLAVGLGILGLAALAGSAVL